LWRRRTFAQPRARGYRRRYCGEPRRAPTIEICGLQVRRRMALRALAPPADRRRALTSGGGRKAGPRDPARSWPGASGITGAPRGGAQSPAPVMTGVLPSRKHKRPASRAAASSRNSGIKRLGCCEVARALGHVQIGGPAPARKRFRGSGRGSVWRVHVGNAETQARSSSEADQMYWAPPRPRED